MAYTKSNIRILLIGSLPPPYGGTSISLKLLSDTLRKRKDIVLTIIDTKDIRDKHFFAIWKLTKILCRIIYETPKVDVISSHLNDSPFAYLGIFLIVIGKIFRKPLIVRKFGGNFFDLGRFGNLLACFVMSNSDICLLQTKILMAYAEKNRIENAIWFPTSRPKPLKKIDFVNRQKSCSRFVYLGHIKKEKGILELIDSSEKLPQHVTVHVYGPFTKELKLNIFENKKRIKYCGIINPDKINNTLSRYDALVFPTYNKKEGYAGAIIEAYFSGLPVICTKWQALPEIVDQNTGILIPIKDSKALLNAMNILCKDYVLYNKLREGAFKKAEFFDANIWINKFVDYCNKLKKNNISNIKS